jgi:hypothetical protein
MCQEMLESAVEYAVSLPAQIKRLANDVATNLGFQTNVEDMPLEGLGQPVGKYSVRWLRGWTEVTLGCCAGSAVGKISPVVRSSRRRAARLAGQLALLNARCGISKQLHAGTMASVELTHQQRTRSRKFGFNKVGVFVSVRSADLLLGDHAPHSRSNFSFKDADIRVLAVDLLTGAPLWTIEPVINNADGEFVEWVHLLSVKDSKSGEQLQGTNGPLFASLLILTSSGNLYTWDIDPNTGSEFHKPRASVCANSVACPTSPTTATSHHYFKSMRSSHSYADMKDVNSVVVFSSFSSAVPAASTHLANEGEVTGQLGSAQYLLVKKSAESQSVSVVLFPPSHGRQARTTAERFTNSHHFVHTIDSRSGLLQTFEVCYRKIVQVFVIVRN